MREFLESSTIHGLSYISSEQVRLVFSSYSKYSPSQTKVAKVLWILVVICGFLSAGYLINDSYSDWHESPISTSISTHPISELEFPTVTVCPPRGSHTALNYDLVKAGNQSLSQEDRDNLKQAAFSIL